MANVSEEEDAEQKLFVLFNSKENKLFTLPEPEVSETKLAGIFALLGVVFCTQKLQRG
jgi:hypothetical protein